MARITASKLRQDIYRLLDQVLETGLPIVIERRGRTLRIVAEEPASKLAGLKERPYLDGDPEQIVHLDWSGEWRP